MPVGQLLPRISSRELTEWAAYERVSGPLGPARQDIHMSVVASTIANTNSKRKYTPKDFMPKWDRKPQTVTEQVDIARQLATSLGGRFEDGGDPGGLAN